MKIILNIMLDIGDRCDRDRTELLAIFKEQIHRGLSDHMLNHLQSIEVEE